MWSERVCAAVGATVAVALIGSAVHLPGRGEPLPSPLTDAQIPRIVALGPWPPPAAPDPSNRVAGRPAAVAFGQRLFNEPALSANGGIACATCHQAARGFSDGLPRGVGLQRGDRNTPGLLNVDQQRWFGWDGAHDSLWAQSLRPLLDPREMGGGLGSVAQAVRTTPALRDGYRAAFGEPPGPEDERVAVDAAKALAAYQATLRSGRTPFDHFRDAVARGDRAAAARYPMAAQRGLAIFVGKGRCWVCHGGPAFSNGEFHDIGRPHFAEAGRVDPGRHGGIRQLQASRYNLLGPYNDDPARTTATSTRHVAPEHRNWGEFKVPSLRNLGLTAPYFHDGGAATLRDVLRHYSELNEERLHADGEKLLVPLKLTEAETDDLLAFLDTLNEGPAR
jgi:cytochrome c peroxidase